MSSPGIGFFGGGMVFIAVSISLFLMDLLHASEWIPGSQGDSLLHHQHHAVVGHSVWNAISTLNFKLFDSFLIHFPLLQPNNLKFFFWL